MLNLGFNKGAKNGMMLEIETSFKSDVWPSEKLNSEVLVIP